MEQNQKQTGSIALKHGDTFVISYTDADGRHTLGELVRVKIDKRNMVRLIVLEKNASGEYSERGDKYTLSR